MNRLLLCITLLLLLAACGRNQQEPAAPAANDTTNAPAPPTAAEPEVEGDTETDDAVDEPEDEEPASEPEPAAGDNPAGLPVNPDPIPRGEPFIVEGTVINASMIPPEEPQFTILGDNGVRYRVNSQPASAIFREDGTSLQLHQYGPGLRVRATVLLPADAGPADVAQTEDLVILLDE